MSLNNPMTIRLGEIYWSPIRNFLLKNKATGSESAISLKKIVEYLKSITDFVFSDSYPYNHQVDAIMSNYVRTGRVGEHGDIFWLTRYGSSMSSVKQ